MRPHMTLTTHALAGAAAATIFPQEPVLAFVAGAVSHFCIDAIPHWDYDEALHSLHKDEIEPLNTRIGGGKEFKKDVAVVLGDGLLGIALSVFVFGLWLFHVPLIIVLAATAGAIFPDFLHALYFKFHPYWMIPLERFHNWIQTYSPLRVPPWQGVGLQAVLVVLLIGALKFLGF